MSWEESLAKAQKKKRELAEANRLPIGYRAGWVEVIGRAPSLWYRERKQQFRRVVCKCHYCGNTFTCNEYDIKFQGLECCKECEQKKFETHLKSDKAHKNSQTGVKGVTPHPKGYQISKTYKGMRIHLFAKSLKDAVLLRDELQEEMEQYAQNYEHLKAEGGSEEALRRFAETSKEAILHRFQVKNH